MVLKEMAGWKMLQPMRTADDRVPLPNSQRLGCDGWMDGWRDGGQQYPGVPIMEVQVDVYTPDGIAMWVNGGATLCLFFWFLMSSIV